MTNDRDGSEKPEAQRARDDMASFRNRRVPPKTITRPPADKMVRPGVVRGYETK